MNPYHYSVVQVRDPKFPGERRNVGLLVVCPSLGRAWLRSGGLRQRAHLVGDDASFVRSLLQLLLAEAEELAQTSSPEAVHGWLRTRTLPSEDALQLTTPAMGIAMDLPAEVRRLRETYLGKPSASGRTAAEKVRDQVLREHDLHQSFLPRSFASGPATWRFGAVTDLPSGPLVLNTLQFGQRTPERLLDAAFKNIGRAAEVRAYHPAVQWLTVAQGPQQGAGVAAFERARQVMNEAGLQVVAATAEALRGGLHEHGLLS